ncbi:MAG: CinA family protein [Gammaproteobacteria bacterium]
MFPGELQALASAVLAKAGTASMRIAAAETCTAGLLSACLTSVPGASQVFERGFTLYHESAKATGLGVPEEVSRQHGAVSAQVTRALAEGALRHSNAAISAAITGYAGPGGGNERDPVGTVYVAVARTGGPTVTERRVLDGDRDAVRMGAVAAALQLLVDQLNS